MASEYAVTLPYFVADVNTAKEVSGVRCQVSEGKLLVASDALARRGNGVRRSQIGDRRSGRADAVGEASISAFGFTHALSPYGVR